MGTIYQRGSRFYISYTDQTTGRRVRRSAGHSRLEALAELQKLEGTRDGLWDWNVAKGSLYVSPSWWMMLGGRPKGDAVTVAEWEAMTHPDDLPGMKAATFQHFSGESQYFEREVRVRVSVRRDRQARAMEQLSEQEAARNARTPGLTEELSVT